MILCDNIVFELQAVGGVSKYWSKTITRLDGSDRDVVFLEGRRGGQNAFRRELALSKPIIRETGPAMLRRFTRPRARADIFHSSYYRISGRARANVVTIHDLMNEKYPTGLRDPLLSYLKKRACRYAQAILAVSEQTKRDLLAHYSFVDPGRVFVAYNGVDDEFFPEPIASAFEIGEVALAPKGYFLYVGTRGFCKNFPYVLRFLSEAHMQGLCFPLVIVGAPLSEAERAAAEALGIPGDALHQVSGVSDAVLRRLYSNCLALLIPSIYEGFGLPAAEAARCGALVLTARGSALDEIAGDTDYAFDLKREGEIARVLALGFDSARADAERARMQERSLMFNWRISAERLLEIYDEL